jgi:tRNA pseudouridine synthase 10
LPGFSIKFERDGIFIGGRYCKFSRALPQSPWTSDYEVAAKEGNSVSEKVSGPIANYLKSSGSRFVSCGREDIDVRMMGKFAG